MVMAIYLRFFFDTSSAAEFSALFPPQPIKGVFKFRSIAKRAARMFILWDFSVSYFLDNHSQIDSFVIGYGLLDQLFTRLVSIDYVCSYFKFEA
jgi:hypothetical protein